MTAEEIYKAALEKWGPEAQTNMAVEETAEFLNALAKLKRGRCSVTDLIDEIADVTIMMEQMALLYGKEEVDIRKSFKINRLKYRLGFDNK